MVKVLELWSRSTCTNTWLRLYQSLVHVQWITAHCAISQNTHYALLSRRGQVPAGQNNARGVSHHRIWWRLARSLQYYAIVVCYLSQSTSCRSRYGVNRKLFISRCSFSCCCWTRRHRCLLLLLRAQITSVGIIVFWATARGRNYG